MVAVVPTSLVTRVATALRLSPAAGPRPRRLWSLRARLILLVLACILPIAGVGGLFVAGIARHLLDIHAERMQVLLVDANHHLAHGAAGTVVPASLLQAALAAANHPPGGGFVLADAAGRVVATSLAGAPQPGEMLPDALRHAIAAGTPPVVEVVGPGGGRYAVSFARSAAVPLLSLSVWEQASARSASWTRPLLSYALLMLLVAVAALIAVTVLAMRLVQPLEGLTEHARAVAGGQDAVNVPAPISRVAEFEALRLALAHADLVLRQRAATEHRALREAQDRQLLLASVIGASTDGITVKALDGRYLLANRAAMTIMALTHPPTWLVGRVAGDLLQSETAGRIDALDREVIATGASRSLESGWPLADRPVRQVLVVKSPWRDNAGTISGVVTVMRDVTSQRRDEARLHALQGELAQASRLSAMGVMASGLAHDLNQPLAAAANFLGAARRLLVRAPAGDPAVADAVDEAVTQVLRAGGIVNALRGFLEGGQVRLVPTKLADLLQEACAVARADGTLATARLSLQVADDVGPVLADRTQMQQVVVNLIRNAAEAIAMAPPRPDDDRAGQIGILAHNDADGWVAIEVTDSGPGLADSVADRLFHPFVSTKPQGLGIGLAICHTIVQAHGGRLVGGTSATGGAVFTVHLPPLPTTVTDPPHEP